MDPHGFQGVGVHWPRASSEQKWCWAMQLAQSSRLRLTILYIYISYIQVYNLDFDWALVVLVRAGGCMGNALQGKIGHFQLLLDATAMVPNKYKTQDSEAYSRTWQRLWEFKSCYIWCGHGCTSSHLFRIVCTAQHGMGMAVQTIRKRPSQSSSSFGPFCKLHARWNHDLWMHISWL